MSQPRILTVGSDTVTPVDVQYLRLSRDYVEAVAKKSGHNRQRRALCAQAVDAINAALRTFPEAR